MKSTGVSHPRGIPNAGEREPLLAQNTGEGIEQLSGLQVLLKGAWEVGERNTGLLLIMAGDAFFAVMDAAAKILQKVEPPVSTFQVLFSNTGGANVLTLPHKLMIIRMSISYMCCMIYMCVRSQILLRLVFASLE
jgi:hypothetical protein